MDTTVLLVTLIIEILLYLTRLIACWLKLSDSYGGETEHIRCKWELVPFDFSVDWYQDEPYSSKVLGNSRDKGLLPPNLDDPHPRDV